MKLTQKEMEERDRKSDRMLEAVRSREYMEYLKIIESGASPRSQY